MMFTLLMPHPTALIREASKKTLIIADLHLGWELALQEKGINLPSQTTRLLEKLVALLVEIKPDALFVVGDVKYTVITSNPVERQEISVFFSELRKYVAEIGVIRGNHDAKLEHTLPENVRVYPSTGIKVDNVGLFHGHKWPSPALLGCKTLVMGHLHPVIVFRDPAGFKISKQVWMRVECNTETLAKILLQKHHVKIEGSIEQTLQKHYGVKLRTEQIFIMPSFNNFLGGRAINENWSGNEFAVGALIGPILRSAAVNVNNSEMFLLDGTYLGKISQLRQ